MQKFITCWFLSTVFVYARCENEVFKKTHPLYGMATLIKSLGWNESLCYQELDLFALAMDEGKFWAIKVFDANGQPAQGFIYSNNFWLGSHAQCNDVSNTKPLEVNHEKIVQISTPYDYPPYKLKFAVILLKHNSTMQYHTGLPMEWTIQLGLCLPASCEKNETLQLAETYFSEEILEIQNTYKLNLTVEELRFLREDIFWIMLQPKTIIFSVVFLVIIMFAILGTTVDVKKHYKEKNMINGYNSNSNDKSSKNVSTVELVTDSTSDLSAPQSLFKELITCFSLYTNTKNLVKTKLSSETVTNIYGLRFFGMFWVIIVHGIFYQGDFMKNPPIAYRLSEDIPGQIFSNSTYCVDTYLFISGFLMAYMYYRLKHPHKSHNTVNYVAKVNEFFLMFINRFFRLTPPYVIVLLFSNVMFTFYRQTSSLTSSEHLDEVCDKYWWRNILYINNLFPRKEMCMSWSWYLSLDTQAFIVSSILLILSTITFHTSAVLTVLILAANVIATAYKSYTIGYVPTLDEQLNQLDAIYDLPWNRIGPYIIGVITAYILKIKLEDVLILTKRKKYFFWIIFPLINLWILFTIYTRQLTVEFSAMYMATSRILWGIGIGWLVIACSTGNAGVLNKFLSFRGFVPLSRLTYFAYLLNPITASMIYMGSETSYNVSMANIALSVLGILITTFLIAFPFYLLFEAPFVLLTRKLMDCIVKKHKKTESSS